MAMISVKLETAVRRSFRVEQVAGMFDVPLGKGSGLGVQGSEQDRETEGRRGKVNGSPCCPSVAPSLRLQSTDDYFLVQHLLTAEVPGLDEDWTIGAIVGPSGSGKTTLARAAFGAAMAKPRCWPKDQAIIDVLGEFGNDGGTERQRDGEKASMSLCPSVSPSRGLGIRTLTIKGLTRMLVAVGLGSPPTWLKPYHVLSTGERFRADLLRALIEGERNLTHRRKGAENAKDSSLCAS